MVYIRGGSKGCWTCRDRRIKCDGTRPAPCARCQKSNRHCKGYEDGKFVHYTGDDISGPPRSRKQWRNSERTSESDPSSSSDSLGEPGSNTSPKSILLEGNSATYSVPGPQPHPLAVPLLRTTVVKKSEDDIDRWISCVPYPPVSKNDRVALSFIIAFNGPLMAINHLAHGQFATFIPPRIGSNSTLDSAVACVNAATAEVVCGQVNLHRSRAFYMQAIGNLRKALMEEKTSRSPEVLVATLLLQIYELHTNDESIGLIAHAGGAIRLIEARGPEEHKEGIGKAVLLSMQAPIVLQAIKQRRRCFLAEGSWRGLIDEIGPKKSGSTTFPACMADASGDLFKCSVHHPGVIEAAATSNLYLIKSDLADCENIHTLPAILVLTLDQRARYHAWRDRYAPTPMNGYVLSDQWGSEHEYADKFQAIFDITLQFSLIGMDCILCDILPRNGEQLSILQNLLLVIREEMILPPPTILEREIQVLTRNILYAYEYVYSSPEFIPRYINTLLDDFCKATDMLSPEAHGIVRDVRRQISNLCASLGK